MGHGGYGKRSGAAIERKKPAGQRRPKALAIDKKSKATKPKSVTFKNQIRSIERMLRKDLPLEIKEAQEKKLEELKRQQDIQNRLALERKIFLRYRRIKFFERRKIERRIRRLEKQQRASTGQAQEADISEQLSKLKEDLEYVKFFPKTEKYVSLYVGGDEAEIVEKRNTLRKQIKDNLIAAAASGKDLEETGSEDDGTLDPSDDDFFLNGSSSEEAEADDEWSARDQASSASGKAASGMSSDERNQKLISARALMPPPGPSRRPIVSSTKNESRFAGSNKKPYNRAEISTSSNTSSIVRPTYSKKPYSRAQISTSSNTSSSFSRPPSRKRDPMESTTGTLSSNSDARKPRRKRRPKKKRQQTS
ncbi:rRNA-processing protein EFG1-like [Salvia miltiorrhiza]|uniref:rRNA-processing protein EFG1-like n=1 Tax=Salvia miltiorrhiza TaxID=226208 RepID=UPI0025AB8DA5|nr:rRNA-processing protein EFG1-like [Salvia miltiorrhiza]